MKKPAIIGGIGPESTIEYYRQIIRQYQEKLNTRDYPEVLIHSINMTKMLELVFSNQLDRLVAFLMERISVVEKAGADFVAIASNTPHLVFDQLVKQVHIPMISILEETCKAISKNNFRRVGLFGTKSTMSSGIYHRAAEKHEIIVCIPSGPEQDFIHDKYMSELVYNIIKPETKSALIEIVRKLHREENIEGLILGGTELPLILNQEDFQDIHIFDTTRIHVKSIVEMMVK